MRLIPCFDGLHTIQVDASTQLRIGRDQEDQPVASRTGITSTYVSRSQVALHNSDGARFFLVTTGSCPVNIVKHDSLARVKAHKNDAHELFVGDRIEFGPKPSNVPLASWVVTAWVKHEERSDGTSAREGADASSNEPEHEARVAPLVGASPLTAEYATLATEAERRVLEAVPRVSNGAPTCAVEAPHHEDMLPSTRTAAGATQPQATFLGSVRNVAPPDQWIGKKTRSEEDPIWKLLDDDAEPEPTVTDPLGAARPQGTHREWALRERVSLDMWTNDGDDRYSNPDRQQVLAITPRTTDEEDPECMLTDILKRYASRKSTPLKRGMQPVWRTPGV